MQLCVVILSVLDTVIHENNNCMLSLWDLTLLKARYLDLDYFSLKWDAAEKSAHQQVKREAGWQYNKKNQEEN